MFGPFYSGDSSKPFIMRAPFVDAEPELTISAKYPGTIPYPQKIEVERIADGLRYRYIDPPSGWIEKKATE